MGWIIGIYGTFSEKDLIRIKSFLPPEQHTFRRDKIFIAAGGIPETCISQNSENNSVHWFVCGIGIKYENGKAAIMDNKAWNSELTGKNFNQFNLNGHFVAARWNINRLELFTDQLGIRNFYISKLNDSVIFSTRPDWISRLGKDISIDWGVLGERWLLLNQLSDKCVLKKTERLCQGGKAVFTLDPLSVQISNKLWSPESVPPLSNKLENILKDFIVCGFSANNKLSLALSGGLDSRILLSLMLSLKSKNWCLHSLNNQKDPDRRIAERISAKLKIEHYFWEPSIPSVDESLRLMSEFTGQTMLANPVISFLTTRFYSDLYNQNKIVIDGSNGEIARRRFFVNLQLRGRRAIYENDYSKLIQLLQSGKPEFFTKDILHLMKNGMRQNVNRFCSAMPAVKEYGIDNWLDLFVLRTRLPNSSAPEQARSDSEFINYMPYIQPAFLKKVFETPVKERNNNKIFYKIIRDNSPQLSGFPLVKDGIIYPFGMNILFSSLWVKLKRKSGFVYKDNLVNQFLESISEYVQDTFGSAETRFCDYYDSGKVQEIINEFYTNKNFRYSEKLNWLLTFETWRRTLKSI